MLKARPAKEIILKLQNEVGALDRIARTIADKGINLLATSTWVEGDQAVVHLVTEDNVRVLDALKGQSWSARESDVVVTETPHKPGMLRHVTDRLSRGGIDIHHLYATASLGQDTTLVVLATANNDRAVVLLNG